MADAASDPLTEWRTMLTELAAAVAASGKAHVTLEIDVTKADGRWVHLAVHFDVVKVEFEVPEERSIRILLLDDDMPAFDLVDTRMEDEQIDKNNRIAALRAKFLTRSNWP